MNTQKQVLPPRIKPVTTRRELTPKERLMAVLLSANIHGLIRDLDNLKHTEIYQHKVKMTGNAFLSALEGHAKEKLWGVEIEGSNVSAAAEQLDHIAQMHRNLLFTVMMAGEMHESQLQLFWQEMQMTFKRHKIPLQLTPDGNLIPLSNDQTPKIIEIPQ